MRKNYTRPADGLNCISYRVILVQCTAASVRLQFSPAVFALICSAVDVLCWLCVCSGL